MINYFADWDSMSIQDRYNSTAAAIYRDRISTLAEGKSWNIDEARAKVKKSSSGMSQSKSYPAMSSYQQEESSSYQQQDYSNINTREFKDKRDGFFTGLQAQNAQRPENLKPSEGKKKSESFSKFYECFF